MLHAIPWLLVCLVGTPGTFANDPAVGMELKVWPEAIVLTDLRDSRQVLATLQRAPGTTGDVTASVAIAAEPSGIVRVDAHGRVWAVAPGMATLTIALGNHKKSLPVEVKATPAPRPISFRTEMVAALNVAGCNMGACHGTPSGKNGFRLSLRGYDPDADHLFLTREILGRRANALAPDQSLILRKAMGDVPHEGGIRFAPGSPVHAVMRTWLAEGMVDDGPTAPKVVRLEVLPGSVVRQTPDRTQQLAVLATLSDGQMRDVTLLSNLSVSDPAIAEVSPEGRVTFKQPGEVAVLVRYLETMSTVMLTYLEPKVNFTWSAPPEVNFVDRHVFAKLKQMDINPSPVCDDHVFIRRVHLDLCGVLPTADEVRRFLADPDPAKRSRLIQTLLARPEYADFWTLKFADVLRNSRKSLRLDGIHKFQSWLRDHLQRNTPFDVLTRELLTAQGSSHLNPAASYYRIAKDPESLAETTAQLFFGFRMQCAKCHNHPFERWTQDDYFRLAAFFARVRLAPDRQHDGPAGNEPPPTAVVVLDRRGEVTHPRTQQVASPRFLDGQTPALTDADDRRAALAAWMTRPDNPFFAKAIVNRVWFHLFGKGIVDPVDDFRDSNPPSNGPLLDALAADFVGHGFDLKHLIRTIAESRVYQLSARANDSNQADTKYFSRCYPKLLAAEPLLDAVCQATECMEKYPGLPAGTRATQLPDNEFNHLFLKTFGQPAREIACECERESDSSLGQALQLINGPTIHGKLRDANNRIGRLLAAKASPEAMLEELYLATLSRPPSPDEAKLMLAHVRQASDARRAWEDVHWTLINAKEFLFRH
jgi:hypothetical protein